MTSLKLTYNSVSDLGPVLARVIDHDLDVVAEATLSRESPSFKLQIKSGSYCVRVRQISGVVFDLPMWIEEGESRVVTVEPRPPGAAADRPGSKLLPHMRPGIESLIRMNGGELLDSHLPEFDGILRPDVDRELGASLPLASRRRAWLRLMELHGDAFRPSAWSVVPPSWEGPHGARQMRLRVPTGRLAYVQFGGEGLSWRCVALPPSPRPVVLTIVPSDGAGNEAGPADDVRIEVSLGDDLCDSLLRSLLPREHDVPDPIVEQIAKTGPLAEELLRGKFEDTAAGIVGGYFLLDRGHYDRLHNWPRNLAQGFPWLADGAVLWGWQILRHPEAARRNPKEARTQFLEAFRRGLPVFSQGLKLLKDGLGYFAMVHRWEEEAPFPGERDEAVFAGLKMLSPYLAALDPEAVCTTFTGRNPAEPSVEAITGRPQGPVEDIAE